MDNTHNNERLELVSYNFFLLFSSMHLQCIHPYTYNTSKPAFYYFRPAKSSLIRRTSNPHPRPCPLPILTQDDYSPHLPTSHPTLHNYLHARTDSTSSNTSSGSLGSSGFISTSQNRVQGYADTSQNRGLGYRDASQNRGLAQGHPDNILKGFQDTSQNRVMGYHDTSQNGVQMYHYTSHNRVLGLHDNILPREHQTRKEKQPMDKARIQERRG